MMMVAEVFGQMALAVMAQRRVAVQMMGVLANGGGGGPGGSDGGVLAMMTTYAKRLCQCCRLRGQVVMMCAWY